MASVDRPIQTTPDHDTTVIVVAFVSLGCLLFLAFFAFVVWFLFKKKSKKHRSRNEAVRVDEHFKMKESIVEGPHGKEAVVLSVEDDVHIDDVIKKDDKAVGKDVTVGSSLFNRS